MECIMKFIKLIPVAVACNFQSEPISVQDGQFNPVSHVIRCYVWTIRVTEENRRRFYSHIIIVFQHFSKSEYGHWLVFSEALLPAHYIWPYNWPHYMSALLCPVSYLYYTSWHVTHSTWWIYSVNIFTKYAWWLRRSNACCFEGDWLWGGVRVGSTACPHHHCEVVEFHDKFKYVLKI